jgi:choline-sulfatase
MAVRDGLKYVYVHGEEPQLFDLHRDPHELENRADDPAYGERLVDLQRLAHEGWDPVELRARVIESQQRRHVINEAMAQGRPEHWDVQPHLYASEQYVRRYDAAETSRRRRYPPVDR